MDIEEANKFINSLVKNLQVLCHGHVNFNNSIQVIGHLYLNVDSQTNIDYIVNEKVCKNDNSSTMFVSNSYHSEPKSKVNKNPECQQTFDKSSDSPSEHFNSSQNNLHLHHNLNQTSDTFSPNRKKRPRADKQFIIHPPKVFKTTEVSTFQQSCALSPRTDFVKNDRNLFHNSNKPSTSTTNSPFNNESASQSQFNSDPDSEESKPFQVIPPVDLDIDLSKVKAEPIDPGEDIESTDCSLGISQTSTSNNIDHGDDNVLADDMCSEDYLIGLHDKTLGLYPTAMQQASDLASSSSFNLSSSSSTVGSSSFYNSKNSPVTVKSPLKPSEKKVPCPICGIFLLQRRSLKRHFVAKHLNERVSCEFCGKKFTQTCNLHRHMKNSCPILATGQSGSTNKDDVKKREDDLPFGCKVCDKKFTFQTSLRRHIREKHLNIRFICPHCGMTFTQKVSLFNHVEHRCKGPNPVTFMEKRETLK